MSTSDFITILTAKGHQRATKLIQWNAKLGQVDICSYENMKLFSGEERPVASIYELHDLLTGIERDFSSYVVRGKIADGVDRNRMLRRSRDKHDGIDPTLLPAEHHWIALDIDAIPCPEYIEPEREPRAAAEYVIDQLPEEFHDVTCRWQFTSSQSFKGSTINLRLFYWADWALSDSDLKTWLCQCEPGTKIRRWPMIDAAVFAVSQPVYTAHPIITGMRDPMPERTGILFGSSDEVAAPKLAPEHRRSGDYSGHGGLPAPGTPGLGYEGHCARIGDHAAGAGFHGPIKSAVASYIGRHGSQVDPTWLRSDLEEVIRRALRDPVKHPDAYIEVRIDDLDPLIVSIVEMERASEEAEIAKAQAPVQDDDDLDPLELLVEQNAEQFEALVELHRRLHNKGAV